MRESKIKQNQKHALIFIDTNILLDFYRQKNEAGLHLLKRIDSLHQRIITSYQIEMEFKKNRQNVILECLKNLKSVEGNSCPPTFLHTAKAAKKLAAHVSSAKDSIDAIKSRIENVFAFPKTHDPVYQTAQRLFSARSPYNLARSNRVRYKIRRLAWKRFMLGYPPRKRDDVHLGDAINWEWIVACVKHGNRDVILITRDTDYGVTHKNKAYPNDWLTQELKKRSGSQRRIYLFNSLVEGLKLAGIAVTKAEIKAEKERSAQREASHRDSYDVFREVFGKDSVSPLFETIFGIKRKSSNAGS